eukprot:CAMPEP_0170536490 /NCGR_PEP_ID=MMETSP0209-20121228/102175_1 /TAXON_ID=665100 ORGANISM="Litonotus pictus, Strain P1" /NCGR_SAMPLE_ID=MMETSP0209 /ASSEMBLY_ACC=CAM_ASM_000301 /LENGTH=1131 /DNA_ID=CAMNT_0010837859 /DNA_START=122 /DNA_END=3516 /DNA_ORIENTATION=+
MTKTYSNNASNPSDAWIHCGNEGQNCSFQDTAIVRYGVAGKYYYKEATNGISCSNTIWGDPAVGISKSCSYHHFVYTKHPVGQGNWKKCGQEGGHCSFTGLTMVRYGANNSYIFKEATDGISCSISHWKIDPIVGVLKSCYYYVYDYGSTTDDEAWHYCGKENGGCYFMGTTVMKYGHDTRWVYKEVTNGITCSNTVLGHDPAVGIQKSCYYLRNFKKETWVECGTEGQTCSFPGNTVIRYGKNGHYIYREAKNSIDCSIGYWGSDPIVGTFKSCYYLNSPELKDFSTEPWIKCGQEGQNCALPSTTTLVRYGHGSNWVYIESSNSLNCSISFWGKDPKVGTLKSCYYKNTSYKWAECAGEGGHCQISGKAIVRYGAGSRWVYAEVENSMYCSNTVYRSSGKAIVRYGAGSRWVYAEVENSMYCSNTVYGDPYYGVYKRCYVLRENLWSRCGLENSYCNFNGESLVKYGANGTYSIFKVDNGIPCTHHLFGDPIVGVNKECMFRVGRYFWVQCAKENGTCNVPGQMIVRYGNNGVFVYREAHNSIGCNNSTFGDPIYGVVKKCEYVVYSTADAPPSIQALKPARKAPNTTVAQNVEYSKCGEDAGFGFDGICLSQPMNRAESGIPSDVKSTLAFIYSVMYVVGHNFDFCVGDWTGSQFASLPELTFNKCNTIPVMSNFKYGAIGFELGAVPCGATPVQIQACASFDRCGTVGIALNAGVLQCAATYSTGLAAILSPISDILDFIAIGFSPKRRFTNTFEIAYQEQGNVVVQSITTYGHFFFKLGLALPLNDLKIGPYRFKDFFTLNVEASYYLDFGSSTASTIGNFISSIKNANRTTGQALLNSIMNSNVEMTMGIKGEFTLNLNNLTRGLFPNIAINIADAYILFSNGGGASGMSKGIYLRLRRGINNLGDILKLIIDQFKGIFSLFGVNIPTPNIGGVNFAIGFFIQEDSVGISVEAPLFSLKCLYMINDNKGGCKFDSQFFTAIIEAAKWVIKHARQFLDETGKEIVRIANDVGKFAENSAQAVGQFFSGDVRNFFERDVGGALVSAGGFFKNDVGGAFNDAGQVISGTTTAAVNAVGDFVNDAGGAINSAVNDAGQSIVSAANTVANTASTVANGVSNTFKEVFRGW